MKPQKRQQIILETVRHNGSATVDALAEQLNTSRETIRRDLTALHKAGLIEKVHGGAKRPIRNLEPAFKARMLANTTGKRAIAVKAASLFDEDDSLFIDTGSTTLFFAEELADRFPVDVITNSILIASALCDGSNPSSVFLLGGAFNASNRQTIGYSALDQIRTFNPKHAVLTVGAISASKGIYDFNAHEAEIARTMIDAAENVTVLVDSSKFEGSALFKVASLAKIDRIIVDKKPPENLSSALADAHVDVIIAEPIGDQNANSALDQG